MVSDPPGRAEAGVHVADPPLTGTWFRPLSIHVMLKPLTTPLEFVLLPENVTLPPGVDPAEVGVTVAVKLTWSP
jgi:hypothetical protein